MVATGPRRDEKFPVEIQTHFTSMLEFAAGPVISFHASFDVQGHSHVPIEIYGTAGTIQVPDPNTFGGPVRLLGSKGEWVDAPLSHAFADRNYRILGIAELATALSEGAGSDLTPVVNGRYRLGDVRHITADSSRARAQLDWAAQVSFEQGMRHFVTDSLRAPAAQEK